MTEAPRRLGDRYELGEVLGRGGMAEVHMARDIRLGRTVAVKTLRADLARDPTFQARFRREAQSAASLNHPSVVAVYDTGEDFVYDMSLPYIVMEYVDGSTLRDLLNSGRRLLPERALELTAGILQALAYSHRNGIVHRDIKPGNVMLTHSGGVKVMDFGIARAVADTGATMTQTAAVIGTAQYLSPEQAKGETVDARSDLYSTGCVLYELLTERPPFLGDSPVSVAYQHVREDPVPPSQFDPEISPDVDRIVLTALAKNTENRYQSADEMRADVERALEGRPVSALPVFGAPDATQRLAGPATDTSTMEPVADHRGGRRRGTGYALLALAALAVFAAAAFLGNAIFGGADEKAVPKVVGLTQQAAERELTQERFKLGEVTKQSSRQVDKGRVISQSPEAEALASRGSRVDLVVSRGPKKVEVPDVVGAMVGAATREIESRGLSVGSVDRVESGQPEGEVLDQAPGFGAKVAPGSQVDLVVSSGITLVEVPDVVGEFQDDAEAELSDAGLDSNVTYRQTSAAEPGTVIAQNPEGGSDVEEGSSVTIVVADAPPEPTNTPPPPPTPPTTPPGQTDDETFFP
ncbi:MAG: Stk1 family PASTA domain-containing Ser/Thr kinase [Carbonactinosporaceae bacterium]